MTSNPSQEQPGSSDSAPTTRCPHLECRAPLQEFGTGVFICAEKHVWSRSGLMAAVAIEELAVESQDSPVEVADDDSALDIPLEMVLEGLRPTDADSNPGGGDHVSLYQRKDGTRTGNPTPELEDDPHAQALLGVVEQVDTRRAYDEALLQAQAAHPPANLVLTAFLTTLLRSEGVQSVATEVLLAHGIAPYGAQALADEVLEAVLAKVLS